MKFNIPEMDSFLCASISDYLFYRFISYDNTKTELSIIITIWNIEIAPH